MRLADPADRVLDPCGHRGARPLGVRAGPADPAAQAVGLGQRLDQGVPLGRDARAAPDVRGRVGLGGRLLELAQPLPVRRPGLGVDDLAGVRCGGNAARRAASQVERGHRGAGPGEQDVQVTQALAVPEPDLAAAVRDRPHLPVPAEDMVRPAVAGGLLRPVASGWRRTGLPLDAGHQGGRAERPGLRHGLGPVRGRRLAVAEHVGQQGQVPVHGTADGGADALDHCGRTGRAGRSRGGNPRS